MYKFRPSYLPFLCGKPDHINGTIAEQLGCAIEDGRYGPAITTNGTKMTSVQGVYAAADIARANNTMIAAADGAAARFALYAGLGFETMPEGG